MITIAKPEFMRRAFGVADGFARQKVDEKAFVAWWENMISLGLATVFYREDEHKVVKEALGVLVFDHPMSGMKSATVQFWFCDFTDTSLVKGLLFRRAEEFIKSLGCSTLYVSALIGAQYDTVCGFLTGDGFRPNEMQFKKDLTNG